MTRNFLLSEFRPVFTQILKYVSPFIAMLAYLQISLQIKITDAATLAGDLSNERLVAELSGMYGNLLLILFFHQFVMALLGANVYSYFIAKFHKPETGKPELNPARLLFPLSLAAIPTLLLATLLSLFGLMLFVIPGVLIANYLSLALFASVYEQKGVMHALGRSVLLVRRNGWRILLLNLTGLAVIYLVNLTVGLPSIIYQLSNGAPDLPNALPVWHWWISGLGVFISTLAFVIPMLFHAFSFIYLTEGEN